VVDTGVSSPPPPPQDDLEATVAMPRVQAPPPPQRRQIDPAVVEPREPVRVAPQPAPAAPPVEGTLIPPPTRTVVVERPQYDFGHPVGYVFARFFAFLIDIALVSVVVTSLAYSLIAFNPITGLPTNSQRGFDATFALGIAIALVYVWICEAIFGTTIAKLILGLRVFAVRGGPVGLGRAFVRGLLRPFDILIIGGIMAMLPGHRRLGDLLGGTVVAHGGMRRFGPILGWVLLLVVAGLPIVLAGLHPTFQSLVAFWEFLPGIFARLLLLPHTLLGMPHW
jgi:uncharacterized RDD family membrane protein YckC